MAHLYALPLPHFRQAAARDSENISRKRKRSRSYRSDTALKDEPDANEVDEEYRAVLDPDDRSQRRLARYSLLKDLPAAPFPHKDTTEVPARKVRDSNHKISDESEQGLRVQHISVLTAILHRSVQNKDWMRARRALGLLLRTEISGHSIDIRAADLWGIGAEILFRQQPDVGKTYSLNGFRMARDYYEKLTIRYPYDRNHPDSINAIDFYLAMFSLWIHVTQAERVSRQNDQDDGSLHDALTEELHEAEEILTRLRKITAQAPFFDNEDVIKLKVDVELWSKNLRREYQMMTPTALDASSQESSPTVAEQQLSLRPASFQSTG